MSLLSLTSCAPRTRRAGFSLMEVMVAMGIFAVGFVVVASIFPVGVLLQKQASDAINSKQVARSAKAVIRGRGIPEADLIDGTSGLSTENSNWDTNQKVTAIPHAWLDGTTLPFTDYTVKDRSFPTYITDANLRDYYIVPLIRDADTTAAFYDWQVYLFVLQRKSNTQYTKSALTSPLQWVNEDDPDYIAGTQTGVPGVRNAAVTVSSSDASVFEFDVSNFNDLDSNGVLEQIQEGDLVLDSFGSTYEVTDADATSFTIDGFVVPDPDSGNYPTEVWFAPPWAEGKTSPAVNIIVLSGSEVVN